MAPDKDTVLQGTESPGTQNNNKNDKGTYKNVQIFGDNHSKYYYNTVQS